jgi:hypothetical protein
MVARHCRADHESMRNAEYRDSGQCNRPSSSGHNAGSASSRQEAMRRAWPRQLDPFQTNCSLTSCGSPPNAPSRHNPRVSPDARIAIPHAACAECSSGRSARRSAVRSLSSHKRKHLRRRGSSAFCKPYSNEDASTQELRSGVVWVTANYAPRTKVMSDAHFRAPRTWQTPS